MTCWLNSMGSSASANTVYLAIWWQLFPSMDTARTMLSQEQYMVLLSPIPSVLGYTDLYVPRETIMLSQVRNVSHTRNHVANLNDSRGAVDQTKFNSSGGEVFNIIWC